MAIPSAWLIYRDPDQVLEWRPASTGFVSSWALRPTTCFDLGTDVETR